MMKKLDEMLREVDENMQKQLHKTLQRVAQKVQADMNMSLEIKESCPRKICCYHFCCLDGEGGGIEAIQEKDYDWRDEEFSSTLSKKISRDFLMGREYFKIKVHIKTLLRKKDIAGMLNLIHKEQRRLANPCCRL